VFIVQFLLHDINFLICNPSRPTVIT